MGDRGNIVFEEDFTGSRIFFYTHWQGSALPHILQKGMICGRGRWGDDSYLARILFCNLVGGNGGSETGYGISTTVCDNEHDFLLVDNKNKKILRVGAHWMSFQEKDPRRYAKAEWTFESYCDIEFVEDQSPWDTLDCIAIVAQAQAQAATDGI